MAKYFVGPPPPVILGSLPRILSQMPSSKEVQDGVNHQKPLHNTMLLSRQGSSNSEVPPAEGNGVQPIEGPPTPTHSESQDCMDARKSKHIRLT